MVQKKEFKAFPYDDVIIEGDIFNLFRTSHNEYGHSNTTWCSVGVCNFIVLIVAWKINWIMEHPPAQQATLRSISPVLT